MPRPEGQQELVLPVRNGLTTSPLPRECSTTELRQHPRCSRRIYHALLFDKAGCGPRHAAGRSTSTPGTLRNRAGAVMFPGYARARGLRIDPHGVCHGVAFVGDRFDNWAGSPGRGQGVRSSAPRRPHHCRVLPGRGGRMATHPSRSFGRIFGQAGSLGYSRPLRQDSHRGIARLTGSPWALCISR